MGLSGARRLRFWAFGAAAAVICVSASLWASPQVLALLREGYPPRTLERIATDVGQGGQVGYLKPEDDLVVVRFGAAIQLLHSTLYEVAR